MLSSMGGCTLHRRYDYKVSGCYTLAFLIYPYAKSPGGTRGLHCATKINLTKPTPYKIRRHSKLHIPDQSSIGVSSSRTFMASLSWPTWTAAPLSSDLQKGSPALVYSWRDIGAGGGIHSLIP